MFERIVPKLAVTALILACAGCEYRQHSDQGVTFRAAGDMSVLIDSATGCQYLSLYKGGVTPRMDASGKQICTGGQP